jgi:hypothetical protein
MGRDDLRAVGRLLEPALDFHVARRRTDPHRRLEEAVSRAVICSRFGPVRIELGPWLFLDGGLQRKITGLVDLCRGSCGPKLAWICPRCGREPPAPSTPRAAMSAGATPSSAAAAGALRCTAELPVAAESRVGRFLSSSRGSPVAAMPVSAAGRVSIAVGRSSTCSTSVRLPTAGDAGWTPPRSGLGIAPLPTFPCTMTRTLTKAGSML